MSGVLFKPWLFVAVCMTIPVTQAQTQTRAQPVGTSVRLLAAGSLREAMTEIASRYEAESGVRIELVFGPSGVLRERIEKGEAAQVFASADTDHPKRLAESGGWETPKVLTLNQMCALAAPTLEVTSSTLLDTLLKADVQVGTSTPRSDPSGDYAWALFRRAEALRPGAYAALDAKAIKLTGSADSPQPPAGRNTYDWLMSEKRADVFVTYCTNAASVKKVSPAVKIIAVPSALQVAASYGVTARKGDGAAMRLVDHLQSASAQAVLASYGFGQL